MNANLITEGARLITKNRYEGLAITNRSIFIKDAVEILMMHVVGAGGGN